jgi:hypothetical protein
VLFYAVFVLLILNLFLYFFFYCLLLFFSGQAIPKGLHVRMNLETGDKEARLMQEDKSGHTDRLPSDSSQQGM